MKKLSLIFIGLFLGVGFTAQAASVLFPYQGGTGTSSVPTYGQMFVGNAEGTYTLTATSSLGITGTGGSGTFSWTPTSYGVSTSTTLGLLQGFLSTASSTIVGTLHGVSLDEIEDLETDKTFNLANKTLTFNYTNPAGGILYNLTGAGSAHFVEINQNTGNPAANSHLLHLQAADDDVLPLPVIHT